MTFQFITLFQRQGALDPISPTPLPGRREGNSHPTLLIRFANSWTSSVFPHQSPRATKRAQKGCLRSCGSFQAGDAVVAVQLLGHVQLFVTPRTAARQASPSITNSQSLLKFMLLIYLFKHVITQLGRLSCRASSSLVFFYQLNAERLFK